MFGYIAPDRPYLFIKDETLYKALYCGVCRCIAKECGQLACTALTYDMAFMSALVHNIRGDDVKIVRRRCPVHPLRRRPMTAEDDVTRVLASMNTALAWHKLSDDKADGEARGALRFLYSRGYKKVLQKHPRAAEIIAKHTAEQAALEERACASIDMACEPTAVMMAELTRYALGEYATGHTDGLSYAIGKWIYLADALDDYDKDVKKGRYNVLYNAFKSRTKAQAVEQNEEEINFIFNALFADMRMHLANVKFHFNHDLTDNIILLGIPAKTRSLVYGRCGQGKKEEQYEQTQS